MKENLLVIAQKIPDQAGTHRDRRTYEMLAALVERFSVHLLLVQTMFVDEEKLNKVRELGIIIQSLREARKLRRKDATDPNVSLPFSPHDYGAIFFTTYFTARYFLAQFLQDMDAAECSIIVDVATPRYIEAAAGAEKAVDALEKSGKLKESEILKMGEISVCNYADIVIIDQPRALEELTRDVPNSLVKLVPRCSDKDNGQDIRQTVQALFEEYNEDNRRQRQNKRSLTETVQQILLPGTASAGSGSLVAAYNRAMKSITAPYGLISDEDSILPESSVRKMFFCAQSHPLNGIVVPASNISLGNITTPAGLNDFLPKHYQAHFGNWQEIRYTDERCLLVKKELLTAVGYLDERFTTLKYALMDLCLKAYQGGYVTLLNNEAFALHLSMVTYEKSELKKEYELFYSKWGDTGNEFLESLPAGKALS